MTTRLTDEQIAQLTYLTENWAPTSDAVAWGPDFLAGEPVGVREYLDRATGALPALLEEVRASRAAAVDPAERNDRSER